jgi:hypothetical protein
MSTALARPRLPSSILPQPANPLEFYETPGAFTRWLFREIPIRGHVFSPCAGSGAIKRAIDQTPIQRWTQSDIDTRWEGHEHYCDARVPDLWEAVIQRQGPIDWTVDNPPFGPSMAILEQALKYSRSGVALHLRASIHEPLKRDPARAILTQHPPDGILWLPRFAFQRSPRTGRWRTDLVCTCWCLWSRGRLSYTQTIQYAPEQVLDELRAETPAYRAQMDERMKGF